MDDIQRLVLDALQLQHQRRVGRFMLVCKGWYTAVKEVGEGSIVHRLLTNDSRREEELHSWFHVRCCQTCYPDIEVRPVVLHYVVYKTPFSLELQSGQHRYIIEYEGRIWVSIHPFSREEADTVAAEVAKAEAAGRTLHKRVCLSFDNPSQAQMFMKTADPALTAAATSTAHDVLLGDDLCSR